MTTVQAFSSLPLLLVLLLQLITTTSAQAPDIINILEKPGQFTVLIRLLRSTGVANQLNGEFHKSNTGFTLFAPPDKAFSDLRSGTINSLSDLQKVQLIQYHILATFVTVSNFQTLSNPVPTQAGDTSAGEFPLNVTSSGKEVEISTGVVNATVGSTVYSDDQLAIYQVDKVLLPLDIFRGYKPPVPVIASPPLPAKVDKSGAANLITHGMLVLYLGISVTIAAAFAL
ncbi:Fasciclin-like arabinogalactan protein 11 [Morella rubra]|uniref:Fasciclin-like arabinogalactan protein 11 n=1 Tax=Morella rubra TaxID=262757 RepID=A0A6A1WRN7_9ROSI|nr:Fasciclin-like arabinogalactan protein 11 [Morella rubra]